MPRVRGFWSMLDGRVMRRGSRWPVRRCAGADLRQAAILLTHNHPDHSGAAASLARQWNCPMFMHQDELPIATGRMALNDRDVFEA